MATSINMCISIGMNVMLCMCFICLYIKNIYFVYEYVFEYEYEYECEYEYEWEYKSLYQHKNIFSWMSTI